MKKNKEIQSGNQAIAHFMGWKISLYKPPHETKKYFHLINPEGVVVEMVFCKFKGSEFKTKSDMIKRALNEQYGKWGRYHLSWGRIMQVIDKIEGFQLSSLEKFFVNINRGYCDIRMPHGNKPEYIIESCENGKLIAAWTVVVRFIEWHNKKTKSKKLKK